jgi:membrane protein DedA with SNARE-associated domain
MLDTLAELPFWQAFAALWAIVMARSNATYWVGRGAIAGWRHHRPAQKQANQARAEALVRRLGPAAVALSYLTIGIQTTIHLTAGLLRMPQRYYVPAAVVGSMAWAALYATIGLALVEAWVAAMTGSWVGLASLLTLIGGGATVWVLGRRRARLRLDPGQSDETHSAIPGVMKDKREPSA